MRAAVTIESILLIIITIVIIVGMIFLMVTNVGMLEGWVGPFLAPLQGQMSGFVIGEACGGIPTSCRRWVYDGLGLFFTYDEAKVYGSANSCGIRPSICPSSAGSRIGVRDCLSLCIDMLVCESSYAEMDFESVNDCYTSVIDGVKS
jgi:hypothetical protein